MLGLSLLLLAPLARADLLVLVHGYLGSPADWRRSGVVARLMEHGVRDAGTVRGGARSIRLPAKKAAGRRGWLYTVALDSRAGLQRQAGVLAAQLQALQRRHPDEPLTLVGHSAGGVVARLAMVRWPAVRATRLISIASPHLGTEAAGFGLDVVHEAKGWLGQLGAGLDSLIHADPALGDLLPAKPGSFLHLLNRQPHPSADYVSIVRIDAPDSGDWLVAPESQRLESVYALRHSARSLMSRGEHALQWRDGDLIESLLDGLQPL